MKKLLKFELYKLKKTKSLYICSAIILALLLFSLLIRLLLTKTWGEELMEKPSAVGSMLSSINSSDFILVVGIFIALYVCGDFSQHTIKNIFSRGFSRAGVYFSKLIICVAYVVIMYFITVLFGLAMSSAFFGYRAEEGHILALLFGQLLVCIAYATFAFSLSYIIKRTGIAVAVVIFAPTVISLVLALIDAAIQSESFQISNYWLDGILLRLSATASSVKVIVVSCILPVVYSALFVTLGYFINGNAEV